MSRRPYALVAALTGCVFAFNLTSSASATQALPVIGHLACIDAAQRSEFLKTPVPGASGPAAQATTHYIELFRGQFACGDSPSHLDSVFAAYQDAVEHTAQPPPLVFFFHGGLDGGQGEFHDDADTPPDAPFSAHLLHAFAQAGGFPIFTIWHSGHVETGLPVIFQQTGAISDSHGVLVRNEYSIDAVRERDDPCAAVDSDRCTSEYALSKAQLQFAKTERPHEMQFLDGLIDFASQFLRTHNIGNGANMWRFMEDEIDDSFRPQAPFERVIAHLASLADSPDFKDRPLRVILIGHSMGSIYSSRLVEEYDRYVATHAVGPRAAGLQFELIFLAPAVKYDVFLRALTTKRPRISHFRMFTMYNACEREDHVARAALAPGWGDVFPGSLLYYVSTVTEPSPDTPVLGLDHFWFDDVRYGNYAPIVAVKSLLQRITGATNQSPFVLTPQPPPLHGTAFRNSGAPPPEGWRSQADRHGDFPGDPQTIESMQHIITYGFGTETPQAQYVHDWAGPPSLASGELVSCPPPKGE